MKQGKVKSRRTHTSITVIILAMIFCVAMLGGAGYFVYTHRQTEIQYPQLEPEARVQSGTLHDPAGRQAELDTLVREGMLTFSINTIPSMRVGETGVNLLIENPPDNGDHFTMTINREDAGEEVYKSGYLNPEQYIEEAPLNMELPAGEYPCVASFDAYRISDDAYTGRASARITLYAQN